MPFGSGRKDNVELISIRMKSAQEMVEDVSMESASSPPESLPSQCNQENLINQGFNSFGSERNEDEVVTTPKRVTIDGPHNGSEPGNHHVSEARLVEVRKSLSGRCGFRLTRTVHDPYPWVRMLCNPKFQSHGLLSNCPRTMQFTCYMALVACRL